MFVRTFTITVAAAMLAIASYAEAAGISIAPPPSSTHMELQSSFTTPPSGFRKWCTMTKFCNRSNLWVEELPELTHRRWEEIVWLNAFANQHIQPASDIDIYQEKEMWAYVPLRGLDSPTRGDCDDYVIFKQEMLIEWGWPANSLLITTVKDTDGGNHAVLSVVTKSGVYILDNLTDEVKPWDQVPYKFEKRQSFQNPTKWQRFDEAKIHFAKTQ